MVFIDDYHVMGYIAELLPCKSVSCNLPVTNYKLGQHSSFRYNFHTIFTELFSSNS